MKIYNKSKYGGREMISMEECCAAESRSIDHYLANSDEMLLKAAARLEKLDKDKTKRKNEYSKRKERKKIHELRGMQLLEKFGKIQTIKSQKNHGTDSGMDF